MKLLLPLTFALFLAACAAPTPVDTEEARQARLEKEARENFYALKASLGQRVAPRNTPEPTPSSGLFAASKPRSTGTVYVPAAAPVPRRQAPVAPPATPVPRPLFASANARPPQTVYAPKATPAPRKQAQVVPQVTPKPRPLFADSQPQPATRPAPTPESRKQGRGQPAPTPAPTSSGAFAYLRQHSTKPVPGQPTPPPKGKASKAATLYYWQVSAPPQPVSSQQFSRAEIRYARKLGKNPANLTNQERLWAREHYR